MAELFKDTELTQWERDHELITGAEISLPGFEGVTYDELFERYANSPYGIHHAEQAPRYSNVYAYGPERMLRDMGDDVHPVEHMRYTHDEIQIRLMYMQNCLAEGYEFDHFSPTEIVVGRLTPLFHDMGECEHDTLEAVTGRVVGDVAWGTKSDDDEAVEAAIRAYFYSELYGDVPAEILAQVEETIMHSNTSFIAESFAATERIGYYLTALRAGYLALIEFFNRQNEQPKRDDHEFAMLTALAKKVTDNHRDNLYSYGQKFPYARVIVEENTSLDNLIHQIL